MNPIINYRDIIRAYIKEHYVLLTTQEHIDDVLIKIFNDRITLNKTIKYTISSFIRDNSLREYFNIAWDYIYSCYSKRNFAEYCIKKQAVLLFNNNEYSEDFDKACKSYDFYKSYTPASSIEAELLEKIWSCRVIQPSKFIQYKNPIIYHIPMGGINKRR